MREFSRQRPRPVAPEPTRRVSVDFRVPKKLSVIRQTVRLLSYKLARSIRLSPVEQSVIYILLAEVKESKLRLEYLRLLERDLLLLNSLLLLSLESDPSESWVKTRMSILRVQTLSPRAVGGIDEKSILKEWFSYLRPRRLIPTRFIGVGYKDKGHRRIPAFDGSQSWSEVACSERMRKEATASNPPTYWWNTLGDKPGAPNIKPKRYFEAEE